jgi:hypothetical protein
MTFHDFMHPGVRSEQDQSTAAAIQTVQKPNITAEFAETAENAAQREMLSPQSCSGGPFLCFFFPQRSLRALR